LANKLKHACVVVGGSSGIGLATAVRAADAGAAVMFASRSLRAGILIVLRFWPRRQRRPRRVLRTRPSRAAVARQRVSIH